MGIVVAEQYDAIIIGAGIIGASVGLELARRGWKTLNLDRLPAAGYGSTSASCAIIRSHYSTLDGTALAFEGYQYWKNWAEHLGVVDDRGLAEFREVGYRAPKVQWKYMGCPSVSMWSLRPTLTRRAGSIENAGRT